MTKINRHFVLSVLVALGVSAGAGGASADQIRHDDGWDVGQKPADTRPTGEDWQVKIGGGAFYKPKYEGADDYELQPLPYVDIRYKDRLRLNAVEGLRFAALQNEDAEIGIGIAPDFGREDEGRLRGLGDVDWTAEGLVYGEYKPGAARFKVTASQDFFRGGHEGVVVDVGADYTFVYPEKKTFVRPSVGATWASDNYMDSYFSVNAQQAAASQFAAYDADAGLKDIGAGVHAGYSVTENWSMNGIVKYNHLMGDASDSPISQSDSQISAGLFAVYVF